MSLRRRLLLALWISTVLVGIASARLAYVQALASANELLDYQLQQVAGYLAIEPHPDAALPAGTPKPDADHDDEDDLVVSIETEDGASIFASNPEWSALAAAPAGLRNLKFHGVEYRAFVAHIDQRWILVAQQIQTRVEAAEAAALSSLLPVVLLIPVLGVTMFLVTQLSLKPLRRVTQELARRPALSLSPLTTREIPKEVAPLIVEINQLLARLEVALEREKRFIADAAHGLRTPLAALQLQADVLDGSQDTAERQARADDLRRGIRRTARLAEHLLVLSRSGHRSVTTQATAVDPLLAELCDQYAPLAERAGVHLAKELTSCARVDGDFRLLMVAVGNLLDNAIRYSPTGGAVEVLSREEARSVLILVRDSGPGIAEVHLERVFERFYRVPDDPLHGTGLGLAASRSIAENLGGRLRLRNRTERSGLIAEIRLPMMEAVSGSS